MSGQNWSNGSWRRPVNSVVRRTMSRSTTFAGCPISANGDESPSRHGWLQWSPVHPYMRADWKRLRPRHETLESRMTRKCHVRFGGGRSEQCLPGNSPAAYPTEDPNPAIPIRCSIRRRKTPHTPRRKACGCWEIGMKAHGRTASESASVSRSLSALRHRDIDDPGRSQTRQVTLQHPLGCPSGGHEPVDGG